MEVWKTEPPQSPCHCDPGPKVYWTKSQETKDLSAFLHIFTTFLWHDITACIGVKGQLPPPNFGLSEISQKKTSCPKAFVQKCKVWSRNPHTLWKFKGNVKILSIYDPLSWKFAAVVEILFENFSVCRKIATSCPNDLFKTHDATVPV